MDFLRSIAERHLFVYTIICSKNPIHLIMGSPDLLRVERHDVATFGNEPLLMLPNGRSVDLTSGYIPLLTRFTFEDKAAKGLRKRRAGQKPEPPIHFSALELVRDNQILLLTGPSGSGKTSFAKHLCFQLTNEGFKTGRPLVRNELGDVHQESWDGGKILPYYHAVSSAESLESLVETTLASALGAVTTKESSEKYGTLIVLDGVEKAGYKAPGLLATFAAQVQRSKNTRLLILGEASICRHWVLPPDISRHELPFRSFWEPTSHWTKLAPVERLKTQPCLLLRSRHSILVTERKTCWTRGSMSLIPSIILLKPWPKTLIASSLMA